MCQVDTVLHAKHRLLGLGLPSFSVGSGLRLAENRWITLERSRQQWRQQPQRQQQWQQQRQRQQRQHLSATVINNNNNQQQQQYPQTAQPTITTTSHNWCQLITFTEYAHNLQHPTTKKNATTKKTYNQDTLRKFFDIQCKASRWQALDYLASWAGHLIRDVGAWELSSCGPWRARAESPGDAKIHDYSRWTTKTNNSGVFFGGCCLEKGNVRQIRII